jgi:hypothetical protein
MADDGQSDETTGGNAPEDDHSIGSPNWRRDLMRLPWQREYWGLGGVTRTLLWAWFVLLLIMLVAFVVNQCFL